MNIRKRIIFPLDRLSIFVFFKDGHFSTNAVTKVMSSARAIKSLKNSFLLAISAIVTVNISGILIRSGILIYCSERQNLISEWQRLLSVIRTENMALHRLAASVTAGC